MVLRLLVIFCSCLILSSSHIHQAESGFLSIVGGWNHVITPQSLILGQERVDFLNFKLAFFFNLFFIFISFHRNHFYIVTVVFRSLIQTFKFHHVVCCVNSYMLPSVCHLHFSPLLITFLTPVWTSCYQLVASLCCFISVSTLFFVPISFGLQQQEVLFPSQPWNVLQWARPGFLLEALSLEYCCKQKTK